MLPAVPSSKFEGGGIPIPLWLTRLIFTPSWDIGSGNGHLAWSQYLNSHRLAVMSDRGAAGDVISFFPSSRVPWDLVCPLESDSYTTPDISASCQPTVGA